MPYALPESNCQTSRRRQKHYMRCWLWGIGPWTNDFWKSATRHLPPVKTKRIAGCVESYGDVRTVLLIHRDATVARAWTGLHGGHWRESQAVACGIKQRTKPAAGQLSRRPNHNDAEASGGEHCRTQPSRPRGWSSALRRHRNSLPRRASRRSRRFSARHHARHRRWSARRPGAVMRRQ
jgi:hypothetical protein